MPTLEEIAEAGVAAHEQFIADMRALDYAWLQSTRGVLTKPLAELSIGDIAAARQPFDTVLDQIIQQEVGRVRSDSRPDVGGS